MNYRVAVLVLMIVAFAAAIGFAVAPQRGGGAQTPPDPGPAADLVKAALDAFNRRDLDYFRKNLADDAIWLDDDGHVFTPKNRIIAIPLTAELTGPNMRKITPSNIRSGMTSDAAWATLAYELDTDGNVRRGLSTIVFKKVGENWQIVVVQAAYNMPEAHLFNDVVNR
jgi:ketosteroid isomerase-like protein